MPITYALDRGVIISALVGRVTDDELIAHYSRPEFGAPPQPWRELVDGSAVTQFDITPDGHMRLGTVAAAALPLLLDGRVAMCAEADAAYGMFRMWEMQREGMGYEVRVFRTRPEAMTWLLAPVDPAAMPLPA